MEKFLSLTHANGRILINIRNIIGVLEYDGTVYVSVNGGSGEPVVALETYDQIMEMINNS
jgi:hypothetical protein